MIAAAGPAAPRIDRAALNPELRRVFAAVHAAAPEAYLVGGGVRDLLRGRAPADLDFTTTGDVRAAAEAIATALGGSAFGLAAEQGQYRIVLPDGGPVREIDVSRQHGDDIAADLARRDFTINALAAPLGEDGGLGEVVDPAGRGVADLARRRVRLVSRRALADDPLRLLRAVRFAVELDFEIETGTAAAIRKRAASLRAAAAERQRDELARMLATPRSAAGVRLLDSLGLLEEMIPELNAGRGVEQPGAYHHWDVFGHSIETLAALDEMLDVGAQPAAPLRERPWLRGAFRDGLAWYGLLPYLEGAVGGQSRLVLLKLAGLLHDVAKPETKSMEAGGRVRFFGHAELGAGKAARVCERLRFGSREARFVARLVEEHMRPTQLSQEGPPSQRAVYRFFRDLGGAAPACLILSLADAAAAAGPRMTPERWQGHVAYAGQVLRQGEAQSAVVARAPRLVTGNDLMEALDLAPGPLVGRLLAAVEEAVAAGEVATRDEAIACAARLLTSPPAAASPSPSTERGAAGRNATANALRGWQTSPQLWERLKPLAREKRHSPTPAEDKLWQALRRRQMAGLHFRRQHSIDRFIVDFCCPSASLVIEVDGPIHGRTREEDRTRQGFLESLGLRVLRFDNEQVASNTESVLDQIQKAVTSARRLPLSASGEGDRGGEGAP